MLSFIPRPWTSSLTGSPVHHSGHIGHRAALIPAGDIVVREAQLGAGRFGNVMLGEWLGVEVAIKVCRFRRPWLLA